METLSVYKYFLISIISIIAINATEEVTNSTTSVESPRQAKDSYIEALTRFRKGAGNIDKRVVYVTALNQEFKPTPAAPLPTKPPTPVRREDSDVGPNAEPYNYNAFTSSGNSGQYSGYSTGYDNAYTDSYLPQNDKYGPPKKYGAPVYKPKYNYGPPEQSYGPPSQSYGPPAPVYGPPAKPSYGVPYGAPSFFDKFSLKLDLLTLAKIFLKLIIFKKIVKFIAVVCLLMFIPKLIHIKKNKDEEDEDEERKLMNINAEGHSNESLNTLTAFVQHAVDTYSLQQKGCENVGCRMKRVVEKVDEEYTLSSISEMFDSISI